MRQILPIVALLIIMAAVVGGRLLPEGVMTQTGVGATSCSPPKLPLSFHVNQKVIAAGWNFEVKSDDGNTDYGSVQESLLSWEKKLIWSFKSTKQSTGVEAAISWGEQIKILDCNQNELATLQEQVFAGFSNAVSKYSIENKEGTKVGVSEKVEWIGAPEFTLKSADENRVLAKIRRPTFSWGDQWQIQRFHLANDTQAHPSDALVQDPRVLIMLAAFKTASKESTTKDLVWWFIIGGPILLCCCVTVFTILVYKSLVKAAEQQEIEEWEEELKSEPSVHRQV